MKQVVPFVIQVVNIVKSSALIQEFVTRHASKLAVRQRCTVSNACVSCMKNWTNFLYPKEKTVCGFFHPRWEADWVAYLADMWDFFNEWDVSVQCCGVYLHCRLNAFKWNWRYGYRRLTEIRRTYFKLLLLALKENETSARVKESQLAQFQWIDFRVFPTCVTRSLPFR